MRGHILLFENQMSHRVLLRARLVSAYYNVMVAESPEDLTSLAMKKQPDIAIIGLGKSYKAELDLIRALKTDPATRNIEIIALVGNLTGIEIAKTLASGADDVLDRSTPEPVLMARLRNLIRARNAETLLSPDDDAKEILGFSEAQSAFNSGIASQPGMIALVAPTPDAAKSWQKGIVPHLRDRVEILSPDALLDTENPERTPDVYVIAANLTYRHEGLTLIAELKSRAEARSIGVIAIVPAHDTEGAVTAFNLGAGDVITDPFDALELVARLRAQLRRKARSDQLSHQISTGLKLAVTDALTGLRNRRYAISALARITRESKTTACPFAIMALDLDHFKRVNDTYGHGAGDAVLVEAAGRISNAMRAGDTVARMGGEEFIVIMPSTSACAAASAGERLRKLIEATPFKLPGVETPLEVTVSIGIAMGGGVDAVETLVDKADKALYTAKAGGRNNVYFNRSSAA